jgi:hypothetical protein
VKERLNIDVSMETRLRLVTDAARRRVSQSVVIREALEAYLKPLPAPISRSPVAPVCRERLPSARANLPLPGSSRWLTAHEDDVE